MLLTMSFVHLGFEVLSGSPESTRAEPTVSYESLSQIANAPPWMTCFRPPGRKSPTFESKRSGLLEAVEAHYSYNCSVFCSNFLVEPGAADFKMTPAQGAFLQAS